MSIKRTNPKSHDINQLNRLYAKFSKKWHGTVLRLGYLDAYRILIQFYETQNIAPAKHVLDVGTGTGVLAMSYLERHPNLSKLTVLDASAEMLKEAGSNLKNMSAQLSIIEGMIGTKKVKNNSVDTLLCAHVIEHTPSVLNSLQWFFDVLHNDGTLLLSVSKPHWCTSLVRWKWGHKSFNSDEIIKMLKQVGFTDIKTITYQSGPPSRLSCGYYARKI